MTWTAETVVALWRSHADFFVTGADYLKKYAGAFAEVLELFEKAHGEQDPSMVAMSIGNCGVGDKPDEIKQEFLIEIEANLGEAPPEGANGVAFTAKVPPAEIPMAPRAPATLSDDLVNAIQRLRRLRSVESDRRGRRLAAAAQRLLGRWLWVQRAPDSVVPYRHVREDTTGYTDINAFDRWVRSGGNSPTGTTALNCRDAVLVTAREAGLLSHGQLRAAYQAAAVEARRLLGSTLLAMQRTRPVNFSSSMNTTGSNAYLAYVRRVDQQLIGYSGAIPVSVSNGLIPRAGDVVFVKGSPPAHVCISLGRSWRSGSAVDEVASLWHHDGGKFSRQPLASMAYESQLVFVPCPF